jgi:hypothetical protein
MGASYLRIILFSQVSTTFLMRSGTTSSSWQRQPDPMAQWADDVEHATQSRPSSLRATARRPAGTPLRRRDGFQILQRRPRWYLNATAAGHPSPPGAA